MVHKALVILILMYIVLLILAVLLIYALIQLKQKKISHVLAWVITGFIILMIIIAFMGIIFFRNSQKETVNYKCYYDTLAKQENLPSLCISPCTI
jgi:glucan phosphoethanolaminetransferase (alkaline phosphatase superfamily)